MKPYMEKLIPQLLKRQCTGCKEHESNFRILGLNRRCAQNLSNHNTGCNLSISIFPCRSRWKPIGNSLATSRRKYVTSGTALRWVEKSTNHKDADQRNQDNNPQWPLQRWAMASPGQDLHVTHA